MRPDFSVLFLTTLIGAGQGLFLALFTVQLYALFGQLPAPDGHAFYAHGSLLALALLAAGLVASFFHLGRPERAWRAAAMWRTSWLSREVIVLPGLMGAVLLFGAAHLFGWRPALATLPSGAAVDATIALGIAGTLLSFALFLCTAMIYACLPFLQEWRTPLTVVNFVLLGSASGLALAGALAAWLEPSLMRAFAMSALAVGALAYLGRLGALWRNARLRPKSTLASAIGVKHPRIVQIAQGAMGGSFNTREFFHGRSPGFVRGMRWAAALLGFVLPAAAVAAITAGGGAPAAALGALFVVQYLGLVAERWSFFAEGQHTQNLYYRSNF